MSAIETLTARSVCTSPPSPATPLLQPMAPTTPAAHAQHNVHWFRRGLRLHDNPSLRAGLVNATTFRCVFLIDPWFASSNNVGINKWRFLLQCLEDLDASLRKLNSRLFVIRGQPADVLSKLFKKWGTTSLTFEEDPEPYARFRDHKIIAKCREAGIKCISRASHTLFHLDEINERNGGKAPLTYHQFHALIASMQPPRAVEPTISVDCLHGATTPVSDDHDRHFGVPTLEELGFETAQLKPSLWIGGEIEALARLERHLERKAWVTYIGLPKMTPQSLFANKTGLSPYLRFGCLSAKLFYHRLTELYIRVKKVSPPLSLYGQILWRDFFYCAATRNPNFDRMVGNPICIQIPWENNAEGLAKWENGQTGYPWIDAIMIQLREEGWIHHLSRHAVACFLTRGDLWISWEEGMKVFEELLLDADWSVNAGMWMWWSCSSLFQQFFQCYCPVRFGRKIDPNGDLIRKYIPALYNMPTRYIHEPWVAPLSVQEAAKCIVGLDYPLPMVDHAKVSEVNISRINRVYERLAQFYPQGSLNSGVMHPTEPNPTSIIGSLKQPNCQCIKSPELQETSPVLPFELFPRSMKVNPAYCGERRSIYNQTVMVHTLQDGTISTANHVEPQETFVANKIYAPTENNQPRTSSRDNEFQSLAINNIVQANSFQNVCKVVSTHKPIPSVTHQEGVEINYNFEKTKQYVPFYPEVAPEHATNETPYKLELDSYTREAVNENTEYIEIDPQTVNMKDYGSHDDKDEQNYQTNNDK